MVRASDDETDVSYDSSPLRPSPSMTSISRTIPFQRLGYPNFSLTTPSSLSSPSSSDVSTTTLSIVSGPSLDSSLLDLLEDEEVHNQSASRGKFRALPTLPTNRTSVWHPLYKPSVSPRTRTIPPNFSSIIPEPFSGAAEQAVLVTKAPRTSKRRRPDYRDIAHKLDLLAKEFYLRDDARRREHRDIMDGITVLRTQLRTLHRHHEEPVAVVPVDATSPRLQVSRSVGDSEDISPLEYIDYGDSHKPDTLPRALSSNDASISVFLSSHYSDEFIVETSS